MLLIKVFPVFFSLTLAEIGLETLLLDRKHKNAIHPINVISYTWYFYYLEHFVIFLVSDLKFRVIFLLWRYLFIIDSVENT